MPLMKPAVLLALLALGLVPLTLNAQATGAPQEGTEMKVDMESTRREIQGFETVIDGAIRDTFSNPFGLVNKPKGAYLPGYGQIFNFVVNIQRAVIKTPFGEYRSGQTVTPTEKKQRIEDLKDRLVRVLLDQGDNLSQLGATECITIIAFFEDRNFPDEEKQDRTVVLTASRKDLNEWAHKADRWKEFKQRMKIIEY
jgi:hypothetical protein